jgi:hypothetical protein
MPRISVVLRVAHVEPKAIHSRLNEAAKHLGRFGGRPESGDDFCFAHNVPEVPCIVSAALRPDGAWRGRSRQEARASHVVFGILEGTEEEASEASGKPLVGLGEDGARLLLASRLRRSIRMSQEIRKNASAKILAAAEQVDHMERRLLKS